MSLIATFLIVFLSGLVIFQTLLAFGAPFGKAAWGGQHDAVLPQKLRISSAISAVFLLFIPPSENPGLSSPGMNDTTSTERALALA